MGDGKKEGRKKGKGKDTDGGLKREGRAGRRKKENI